MSPQDFKQLCIFGFEPWCSAEENPPILPPPPFALPVIDRSKSGFRLAPRELTPGAGAPYLSPGSCEAKVGDLCNITCVVTSWTVAKIKTVILMNGSIVQSWEDEISAGGSVSHMCARYFTEEGTYEISMAVYYWDGSQYVKNDEYGTWVITVT